ncbi:MAG: hypothetical protein ACK5NT_01780 [Pyrinomonadaceae bacterium]
MRILRVFLVIVLIVFGAYAQENSSESSTNPNEVKTPTPEVTSTETPTVVSVEKTLEMKLKEIDLLKNNEVLRLSNFARSESKELDKVKTYSITLLKSESLGFDDPNYKWQLKYASSPDAVYLNQTGNTLIANKSNEIVELEIFKGNEPVKITGVDRLILRVVEEKEQENVIISSTTLLTYKDVEENYGKKIAKRYAVVQLSIRNRSKHSRFMVQNVNISLDPSQCLYVKRYLEKSLIKNSQQLDSSSTRQKSRIADNTSEETNVTSEYVDGFLKECIKFYKATFGYPTLINPTDRNIVKGIGEQALIDDDRSVAMRALDFVSETSGVFTGLNLLGKDGVKAFSLFASPFIPSVKKAVPDVANRRNENLSRALPEGETVVSNQKPTAVFVFIPSEKLFPPKQWSLFTANRKKMDESTYKLKLFTEIYLVGRVKGVLISDDAPSVTSKPAEIGAETEAPVL